MAVENTINEAGESLQEGMIPLQIFNDQEIHETELDRIFTESWIFVGHESEIPHPGDYKLRYIGENPFIFTRDETGGINLLFDSCRHHGTKLCRAEKGNTSHFRCPYHGWTYNNKGELVGVPHKNEGFKTLDVSEYGLHSAPKVENYEGFIFANLSEDAPSFEDYLGSYKWYLDIFTKLADWESIGEPQRWELDVNWKTGAENFAGDTYHTPHAHESVVDMGWGGEVYDPDLGPNKEQYHIVNCDGSGCNIRVSADPFDNNEEDAVWGGYSKPVRDCFTTERLDEEQLGLAQSMITFTTTIFPNCGFFQSVVTHGHDTEPTGIFSLRTWQPLESGKTEFWNWFFAPKDAPREYKEKIHDAGMGTFSASGTFEQDDAMIWKELTESAGANFTHKNNLQTTYQHGWETGDPESNIYQEWPGPGTALETNLEEGLMRLFYLNWYRQMSGEEIEVELPLGEEKS